MLLPTTAGHARPKLQSWTSIECHYKSVGEAVKAMENSLAAKDVTDTSKYAAIFVPGGHGISADGPDNPVLQKLLVGAVAMRLCRNHHKLVVKGTLTAFWGVAVQTLIDLPDSGLQVDFHQSGKVVSSVCHGPVSF